MSCPDVVCLCSMSRAPLYRLLRPLARLLMAAFFRRLRWIGREQLPAEGPVVLVANHPNMLLDGLVLGVSCPRTIHFLGKSTLFAVPGLGWLLRNSGVLPVYRKRDGSATSSNDGTFEACFELLEAGGLIALFPEGTSHSEMKMLSFKTGAARIAMGAAARSRETITVLPCGIWYLDKSRRGSDCLVVYGKPISVEAREYETEEQQREAVRELTATAEDSLRALLIELDDERQARLLELVEGITRGQRDDTLEERYAFARQVIAGYRAFEEEQPEAIADFIAELEEYGQLLDHLDLNPQHVRWRVGRGKAFALFLFNLSRLLLGAAPALAGWLCNLPPATASKLAARALSTDTEEIATNLLLGGMVLFGLWYAALVAAGAVWFGWPGALAALLAPLLGRYGLRYRGILRSFLRGTRVYLLFALGHQVQEGLASRQQQLLDELDRLASQPLGLTPDGSPAAQRPDAQ